MYRARKTVFSCLAIVGALVMVSGCGSSGEAVKDQTDTARDRTPIATTTPTAAVAKLTVVAPQDGTTVTGTHAQVRGTVAPSNATVEVLGRRAKVAQGTFEVSVPLRSGENAIDLVVSAPGVEPATTTLTVTRGKSARQLAAAKAAKRRAERSRARRAAARQRALVVVPNEVDERLDVAEDDLRSKGLRYTELGGGTFGVIVPSNWTVCETRPAAGARVKKSSRVKLVIDREC
jgi:Glucodextranase, domain B/PASTA domain